MTIVALELAMVAITIQAMSRILFRTRIDVAR